MNKTESKLSQIEKPKAAPSTAKPKSTAHHAKKRPKWVEELLENAAVLRKALSH